MRSIWTPLALVRVRFFRSDDGQVYIKVGNRRRRKFMNPRESTPAIKKAIGSCSSISTSLSRFSEIVNLHQLVNLDASYMT